MVTSFHKRQTDDGEKLLDKGEDRRMTILRKEGGEKEKKGGEGKGVI